MDAPQVDPVLQDLANAHIATPIDPVGFIEVLADRLDEMGLDDYAGYIRWNAEQNMTWPGHGPIALNIAIRVRRGKPYNIGLNGPHKLAVEQWNDYCGKVWPDPKPQAQRFFIHNTCKVADTAFDGRLYYHYKDKDTP